MSPQINSGWACNGLAAGPRKEGRKEGAGRKKKRELAVITLLKEGRLDV